MAHNRFLPSRYNSRVDISRSASSTTEFSAPSSNVPTSLSQTHEVDSQERSQNFEGRDERHLHERRAVYPPRSSEHAVPRSSANSSLLRPSTLVTLRDVREWKRPDFYTQRPKYISFERLGEVQAFSAQAALSASQLLIALTATYVLKKTVPAQWTVIALGLISLWSVANTKLPTIKEKSLIESIEKALKNFDLQNSHTVLAALALSIENDHSGWAHISGTVSGQALGAAFLMNYWSIANFVACTALQIMAVEVKKHLYEGRLGVDDENPIEYDEASARRFNFIPSTFPFSDANASLAEGLCDFAIIALLAGATVGSLVIGYKLHDKVGEFSNHEDSHASWRQSIFNPAMVALASSSVERIVWSAKRIEKRILENNVASAVNREGIERIEQDDEENALQMRAQTAENQLTQLRTEYDTVRQHLQSLGLVDEPSESQT